MQCRMELTSATQLGSTSTALPALTVLKVSGQGHNVSVLWVHAVHHAAGVSEFTQLRQAYPCILVR